MKRREFIAGLGAAATWPLAHSPASSLQEARTSVMWTELVGISEMREYFPNSTIVHERVAGLTKSIIAVRVDS